VVALQIKSLPQGENALAAVTDGKLRSQTKNKPPRLYSGTLAQVPASCGGNLILNLDLANPRVVS